MAARSKKLLKVIDGIRSWNMSTSQTPSTKACVEIEESLKCENFQVGKVREKGFCYLVSDCNTRISTSTNMYGIWPCTKDNRHWYKNRCYPNVDCAIRFNCLFQIWSAWSGLYCFPSFLFRRYWDTLPCQWGEFLSIEDRLSVKNDIWSFLVNILLCVSNGNIMTWYCLFSLRISIVLWKIAVKTNAKALKHLHIVPLKFIEVAYSGY